ncbi:MAG: TonB-dependent receptor plug domain-containing protein [Caulobacteraceae bacterium]
MSRKSQIGRKSLLTGASLLAAAAATMGATPAFAQDEEEEAIIVTGSRIPQPNLFSTSPVTQVTAEDVTTAGVTRIEDLTNELPQVFAAQGSAISNGSTGTATVSLRGLGAARTLVLIDGRRMGYGSPNATAADLNQIPAQMVERVEVLTGGASAVYGSDAISGVVNFIMRDDFEGLRFDAQYGFYQHSNDSDDGYIREELAFRASTNPAQFQVPDDDWEGGYGKDATVMFGVSSPDGRGNITAYATYRSNDPILQGDFDYSHCALGNPSTAARPGVPAGATHWTCGGSSTSFPGRFTDFATFNYTIDQGTGAFIPFNSTLHQYNFGPTNYYQRPDERYSFGAFARYEINDSVEAYSQLMFTDYRSVSQIAPSGDFFNTSTINCGNPLLTPGNAAAIGCSPGEIAADSPTSMYIGRRNVEGGGRRDDLNYESYRGVLGIRGPIGENWDYDVSAQYSRVKLARTYRNDFSVTRLFRALDVVDNDLGVGVDPQCRTNAPNVQPVTDANCVPWDIFTPGGVTDAALNYVQIPLIQTGETTQQVVLATMTGETPFRSPMAESNLAMAFGAEYRRDALSSDADAAFQSGDGAGQGGPTLPLAGDTDVFDLFAEARFPLIEGAAFADLLSIDAAYRYSTYGSDITTDTYKFGAEWAPYSDLRFRGSVQRAVRAANVIELFASQGFGLFDMDFDPCDDLNDDGILNNSNPASCIGVGAHQVTAAQSDSGALNSPAGQYNGLFGGNPNLSPEEADTVTLGFVFSPSFVEGLSVSVDWFNIEVTNLVSTTGATNTITDCYVNGTASSCARITRNPGGQLWIGTGVVEDLNTNIGGLETTGVDLSVVYSRDIGDMGGLTFNLIGTWLDELITDPGAATGVIPYECAGGYGAQLCGTPNPEWRHRLRVTWETPFDVDLHATWRYYGEVDRFRLAAAGGSEPVPCTGAGALDCHWDAEHYLDLAGTWDVAENTRLRFGVNNVLDNDPPLSQNVGAGAGNGNTYPQVYDATGRWIFAGITVDF